MCNSKETNNLWSYGMVYACIYNKCYVVYYYILTCYVNLVKIDAKMEQSFFQRVGQSWFLC